MQHQQNFSSILKKLITVHLPPPADPNARPAVAATHLELGETLAHDQRPQVVQHARRHQHQPIKMEILVRIDDGAALLDVPTAPLQRFVMVTGCTLRARLLHRFLWHHTGEWVGENEWRMALGVTACECIICVLLIRTALVEYQLYRDYMTIP